MAPTHLGHGSREGPTVIKPEFFWLAGGGFFVWLVSLSVGGILTTVNLFHLLRKEGRKGSTGMVWCGRSWGTVLGRLEGRIGREGGREGGIGDDCACLYVTLGLLRRSCSALGLATYNGLVIILL